MDVKSSGVTLQKNNQKKNKLLFVTSIILIITSAFTLLGTAFLSLLTALEILYGELNLGADFGAAIIGVSLVFGVVLAVVSFYAALRGIWQNKLIKCRKLGIVILLLNIVSYISDLFSTISLNDDIETIIFQIIFYAAFSLTLPILYLVGANLAIRKSEPDSKYRDIIKSI